MLSCNCCFKLNHNQKKNKTKWCDKNISVFSLPYDTIKTLRTTANSGISDTSYTVRKTFVGDLSSTDITITGQTGESFVPQSETDYSVTIMTAGGLLQLILLW